MCNDYDWFMAFDIDEFLTFTDSQKTIDMYLSEDKFNNIDVIKINWMCFGDSGKLYDEPGVPIWERLTEPLPWDHSTWGRYDNQNIKLIVRTGLSLKYETPHVIKCNDYKACIATGGVIDDDVKHYDISLMIDFSYAYLRHYITKTISEWMENKMQRGYPDYNNYYTSLYPGAFFRHGNEWTLEKQNIIDKYMYENYIRKDGITK